MRAWRRGDFSQRQTQNGVGLRGVELKYMALEPEAVGGGMNEGS